MRIFVLLFLCFTWTPLLSEVTEQNHWEATIINNHNFLCEKKEWIKDSLLKKVIRIYQRNTPLENAANQYFLAVNQRDLACSKAEETRATFDILHQDNLFDHNYKIPIEHVVTYGHILLECAVTIDIQAKDRYNYHIYKFETCFATVLALSKCKDIVDELLDALDSYRLDSEEANRIRKNGQLLINSKP